MAIGTAQFGLDYGLANAKGRISAPEVEAILALARGADLDVLDTASSYGESEQVLGSIGVSDWNVVTKLPAAPPGLRDVAAWARELTTCSLNRLQVPQLHGLLLHRGTDLLSKSGPDLRLALMDLKAAGLTRKIGVSVYSPDELEQVWAVCPLDLVQLPLNVLDRSVIESGMLARLHDAGVEIHVRSVFLQGLLLMDREKRPAYFNRWSELWDRWHGWLSGSGLTPVQACLRFALSHPEVDRVVVGVDSLAHLKEILDAANGPYPEVPGDLRSGDPDLINPSRWKLA